MTLREMIGLGLEERAVAGPAVDEEEGGTAGALLLVCQLHALVLDGRHGLLLKGAAPFIGRGRESARSPAPSRGILYSRDGAGEPVRRGGDRRGPPPRPRRPPPRPAPPGRAPSGGPAPSPPPPPPAAPSRGPTRVWGPPGPPAARPGPALG